MYTNPQNLLFIVLLLIVKSTYHLADANDNLNKPPTSTVTVNLHAKWSYTPLHLEASEFLGSENEDYFWSYINTMHERYNDSNVFQQKNFQEQYQEVLDISDEILDDPRQIKLLKFSLAQRIYSPLIASHEQIAKDRLGRKINQCKALLELSQQPLSDSENATDFDDLDEESLKLNELYDIKKLHSDINVFCNPQDAELVFEKILADKDYMEHYYQPTIYKSDHVYYAHNNPKAKEFKIMTAVIYGEIGSTEFKNLYEYCKKMANLGKMNFVVRHLAISDQNEKTKHRVSLSGYGVELAIKSTEYKAQDDARVKGEATDFDERQHQAHVEKPDEIEDLVFNELAKTNPSFHEDILESIKLIPVLNSTETMDLSYQAVKLILDAPADQQLALMRDLTQNFPIVAKSLSKVKVSVKLQDELERNALLFYRFMNLSPQDVSIFMNGMFFDVDALDMFALFDVIKNEFKELLEGAGEGESDVERFLYRRYSDDHSRMVIPSEKPNEPHLKLLIILDPLSRGAQKILPILITFRKIFNMELTFMFNCGDSHKNLPLKNFFRFAIESEPNFRNGPDRPPSIRLTLRNLPDSSLLTLNMATPENWLVESVRTPYDLDNLHLAEIPGNSAYADFELEHLLLEGHCFDIKNSSPPRGLQFVLGTMQYPTLFDTIVMANLGYFQLKASPGAWNLRLRHGKSADIYVISHVDRAAMFDSNNVPMFIKHMDSKVKSEKVIPTLLSDFRSRFLKVRVQKKSDQRHRDLLEEDDSEDSQSSLSWGSIRNSIWSGAHSDEEKSDKSSDATSVARTVESNRINIFSLASGHLYERLLRIMMLSVLKNTNTPVKFWFLKNFLSPTFKDFLPYYAEKYNFDYELVQYKWPRWLHQQTEKQRIIWGYKILFLDVLFPLDVKKIIFVDADQVVRTDLKELRDLDLEGAPYGYTPFCDSRTDMDGFRFWKTGYWMNHLQRRKYHISALYVVDLQKFRKIAAGDRLRGQYQGLSQDPNSLSNLDQDLPNNMIHQVAIKSLPQEWLWCETWCSDKEKEKAKTIDLCNNPKTKEPKLTSARRIVKEWQEYDDEIRLVFDEVQDLIERKRLDSKTGSPIEATTKKSISTTTTTTSEPAGPETSVTTKPEHEVSVTLDVPLTKIESKAHEEL